MARLKGHELYHKVQGNEEALKGVLRDLEGRVGVKGIPDLSGEVPSFIFDLAAKTPDGGIYFTNFIVGPYENGSVRISAEELFIGYVEGSGGEWKDEVRFKYSLDPDNNVKFKEAYSEEACV